MEQNAQSIEIAEGPAVSQHRWRYLKPVLWFFVAVVSISVAAVLVTYFVSVKRIFSVKKVYEPPPSIQYRQVAFVWGPDIPKHYHPDLIRLFRHLHQIDRKWIRPKWWTKPELSPEEQAAMGVRLGVLLQ